MKLIPASRAAWMIRIDSSWSALPHAPNIIAPRQNLLTETPVRPSWRCSMGLLLFERQWSRRRPPTEPDAPPRRQSSTVPERRRLGARRSAGRTPRRSRRKQGSDGRDRRRHRPSTVALDQRDSARYELGGRSHDAPARTARLRPPAADGGERSEPPLMSVEK